MCVAGAQEESLEVTVQIPDSEISEMPQREEYTVSFLLYLE